MNAAELPAMASAAYFTTTHTPEAVGALAHPGRYGSPSFRQGLAQYQFKQFKQSKGKQSLDFNLDDEEEMKEMSAKTGHRRMVRVIISDPDEKVPLKDAILYSGEEQITDLTDQELFFELDIKGLLEKHNAKRIEIVDKAVKDRTEHLEPIKIRDLKMTVVNIAPDL